MEVALWGESLIKWEETETVDHKNFISRGFHLGLFYSF